MPIVIRPLFTILLLLPSSAFANAADEWEIPSGGILGRRRLVREFEQRFSVKMAEIEKDPAQYQYSSLLTDISRARCPILIVCGKNDQNAPLPVMEADESAMRAAGYEAKGYHPDSGPHGFYFGIPHVIPETAESTRHTMAFIKWHVDMNGH